MYNRTEEVHVDKKKEYNFDLNVYHMHLASFLAYVRLSLCMY